MTQLEMAAAIGIPPQNYRLYENDKFAPKSYAFLRLCVVLQVDPLIFAGCTFRGNDLPPIEGIKVSRMMEGRIAGTTTMKGLNRPNKRKLMRLAGTRKVDKLRELRRLNKA